MASEHLSKRAETLDPAMLEFSFYAFLKFYVYSFIQRSHVGGEGPSPVRVPKPFSSHRVHRLMTGAAGKQFTDFFDLSSYFVRTRLQNLNHGTVLVQTGRGMRNSMTYQWNEGIDASTYQSFLRLRGLLGNDLGLALDVFRLFSRFGTAPFPRESFIELFRAQRDQYVERKWYKISTSIPSNSVQFTTFLLRRLGALIQAELLVESSGQLQLTRKGEDVHHWMELFLYSVRYEAGSARQYAPAVETGVAAQ